MRRAPHGCTKLWKEDLHKRDNIIREHGGYEGLQNAEKVVKEILGERCSLNSLKRLVTSLGLRPPRIAKRRKDLLILWIYDRREQIKNTIAMQANHQTTMESSVLSDIDDDLFSEFEMSETIQIF